MPGIFGISTTSINLDKDKVIADMQNAMSLYPYFKQDQLFSDKFIAASRVHLGKIGEISSPISKDDIYVWVEGEAYNEAEVGKELGLSYASIANLLLDAEKQNKLKSCLNKLDGYFCAAIYDRKNKKIKLISDRYGMRVLYWYLKDGLFAWGSSVKAILAIEGIDKKLDQSSYGCFMDLGYLIGEHTWFENIKLIKPSTVIEFDIEQNKMSEDYYWSWAEIKQSSLSFEQAIDKLGELFIESVRLRFNPNEKIGISLSGGLDSRAIFSAVDYLYPNHKGYAYTFGIPGCDDITIAEQVVAKTNWTHEKFYFTKDNWLTPRFERVWNTDGMLNLLHMHGSEFLGSISKNIDINLSGGGGDAVCGATLISHKKEWQDSKLNQNLAEMIYGNHAEQYDDEFFNIDHFDNYLLMTSIRRFENAGTINGLHRVEQRKPFYDNRIIELIYSVPDSYRVNYKLYSAMLQKFFPKFYKDIPWQRTGKPAAPISNQSTSKRAINKLIRIISYYLNINNNKGYTNYPDWIRSTEVANELNRMLDKTNAHYTKLTNEDLKKKYLTSHLNNRLINNSEKILRAATLEIYLKQVFGEVNL